MRYSEKQSYYEKIHNRYLSSDKLLKSQILNEYCEVCGYNRKYAIRKLNKNMAVTKLKKRPGPKRVYDKGVFLDTLK